MQRHVLTWLQVWHSDRKKNYENEAQPNHDFLTKSTIMNPMRYQCIKNTIYCMIHIFDHIFSSCKWVHRRNCWMWCECSLWGYSFKESIHSKSRFYCMMTKIHYNKDKSYEYNKVTPVLATQDFVAMEKRVLDKRF